MQRDKDSVQEKSKHQRLQVCATTALNRSSHHVQSTTSHFKEQEEIAPWISLIPLIKV